MIHVRATRVKNISSVTANFESHRNPIMLISNGLKKSPLAPAGFPTMSPLSGVQLATTESGSKYRGRDDLMLAVLEPNTTCAGVLTRSATAGAPVLWCRSQLKNPLEKRALLVNAGNANTFTGEAGKRHVLETCTTVATMLGCQAEQVLVASTGVIGEPLPVAKIVAAVSCLGASLSADAWARSAAAILTTDTFAKGAVAHAMIENIPVRIHGFAKGSGMIEPNMATLLAFLFTDAAIPSPILDTLLATATERSFNSITVDSDTSTSDTCFLFATGKAANPVPKTANTPLLDDFSRALQQVMIDLATQVVRDGEGAQKFITVEVRTAKDHSTAKIIAKSIANSPLVKTAIAGEDANWGRIVMAVGKTGCALDPAKLRVFIGGTQITEHARRIDQFDEDPVVAHLRGKEILIEVELGVADGCARVWTCDLTQGYIEINADYRT